MALSARAAARSRRGGGDVEIVLTASNTDGVIANVTDGTCDLGFIESPGAPRSLRSRVLGRNRLVVVVPPGHPWARRRGPVSAEELAATPLVSREGGSGTSQTLLSRRSQAASGDGGGRRIRPARSACSSPGPACGSSVPRARPGSRRLRSELVGHIWSSAETVSGGPDLCDNVGEIDTR